MIPRRATADEFPFLRRFSGVVCPAIMKKRLFLLATFWLSYRYLSTTLRQFPVVAPQAFHAVDGFGHLITGIAQRDACG